MEAQISQNESTGFMHRLPGPTGSVPTVKHWWLVIASLLMRWLPFAFSTPSSLVDFKSVCIILSYVMLLYVLLCNLHIGAGRIIALGTALNFLAIISNHGFMPVSPEARYLAGKSFHLASSDATALTGSGGMVSPMDQTRLWILTDIIPVSSVRTVFSIGDALIGLGILFAFASIVSRVVEIMHTQTPNPHDSKT